jgi:DNA gyrase subunit B
MFKQVDTTVVEIAFQYNDGYSESIYSYANCVNTIDGGTHLTGFRSALTRVLNDYTRKNKIIKDEDPSLTGEDVREGLTAIVSVRLVEPQFEGQTKGKLGNPEIKALSKRNGRRVRALFEEHPDDARSILTNVFAARAQRRRVEHAIWS